MAGSDPFCDVSARCPLHVGWGPCGDGVFEAIRVDYLVDGGARVSWKLRPDFPVEPPASYALEFSRAGTAEADDWTPIGLPVEDGFFAVDPVRRNHGTVNSVHYRVVLSFSGGEFASSPVPADVSWDRKSRLRAVAVQRRLRLKFRTARDPVGFLLKRRAHGRPCPECLDPLTQETRRSDCPTCRGTGFVHGYYPPVGCVYAAKSPLASHERLEDNVGQTNVLSVQALMLNDPPLGTGDVWVESGNDSRWLIRPIRSVVEVAGFPVALQAELRRLPYSDPVYKIPIPEMRADRGLIE